uniref:Uncharacterized protein n=1 Tax=Rhodnius prolixus TaxID=13249 RepID=T1HJ21_RHOPR
MTSFFKFFQNFFFPISLASFLLVIRRYSSFVPDYYARYSHINL